MRLERAFVLPFVLLPLLAAGSPDAPSRLSGPAVTGTIEGTVRVRVPAPRRTAQAYPARGAPAAHQIQVLPTVVYLKGVVPGAAASPTSMAQKDTAFVPGVLVVKVGTTVRFPNQDGFFHNVFSYSGPARFDLGRYPQGESKTVTFDQAGVVKLYCEVHDFMRAAVIVTESGVHAVVGADGRFSLTGVPAGTWTLVVWHADAGESETEVRVQDGATTRVDLSLG